ncbi:MAG: PAS domain S-box protein [Cyanobacteria bacterium TGS_CYA1]|nr:PAS domain S-box protein [Cyanobacteria bacterium TGS_CYA1]
MPSHAKNSKKKSPKQELSEEQLRQVVEASPSGIIMVNAHGEIVLVNLQIEKLFGYTRDQLIGKQIELLVPDPFKRIHPKQRESFFANPSIRSMGAGRDLYGLKADNTLIPVEIGLNPLDIQGEKFVLASVVDITERKRSEERLKLAIEASPSGMLMVDINGQIVLVNAQIENLFGYQREELIGQKIEKIVPVKYRKTHPNMRKQFFILPEARAMGAGRDLYGTRKDGFEFPVEIGLNPITTESGQFVLASVVDITERRKAEQELLRANEELESRVSERTKQLEEARDEAREASRLKSEFLANMSHEIRTPMNAVIGMCNILSKTQLDTRQQQYSDNIRDGANTLLTIINDILDFSKIEAGHMEIEAIDFDVVRVVESTCEMLATAARNKKLSLLAEIDEDIPSQLRGDPERLRQILINLLSNAIKFSAHGNIVVKTKLEKVEGNKAWIYFSVADQGIGIDQEQFDRLFKPFEQADGSISRRFGGTGLGLSICKRLVELMSGDIGVKSTSLRGSEFWIQIPFEIRSANKQPFLTDSLRSARILIVEDDPYAAQILSKYISSWAIENSCAHSGKDAITALRQAYVEEKKFDIVVVDYMLPDKNGIELAQQIFSDPAIKDTKLILLTAFDTPGLGKQAIANGFKAYLTKPVRRSSLLDALSAAWGFDHPVVSPQSIDGAEALFKPTERTELILVVEDYPINQQVAQLYLEQLGFSCHIANNGIEALQAMKTSQYSLILMDCQMPDMDGYVATKKIRDQEENSKSQKHIPIIALTAHAISGDKEKCLEAGMDDYLVKPMEPEHLHSMLLKWLPETTPSYIDIVRINSKYGKSAQVLMERYLQDAPPVLEQILNSFQVDDRLTFQRTLHGLKGISTTVCARPIVERCMQIENAAYDQNWPEVRELVCKLETEMAETLAFITSKNLNR